MKTLYQVENYRIIEIMDDDLNWDRIKDLKGDCYNPEVNKDICPEKLKEEEIAFEEKCWDEGLWGYALERWNPEVGAGWEVLDSCWGFVGRYETEKHYIFDELYRLIEKYKDES